jgi:hypothetical protein
LIAAVTSEPVGAVGWCMAGKTTGLKENVIVGPLIPAGAVMNRLRAMAAGPFVFSAIYWQIRLVRLIAN